MNLSQGEVVAVCISEGGIPRMPVAGARLTFQGFPEDGHRYPEHYQPARAVTLFNLERLEAFEDGVEHFPPGSAGENITIRGLDLEKLSAGDRLRVGEAELRLEKPWKPCYAKNAATGATRPNTENRQGFFASVIREGDVGAGDDVIVTDSRDA